MRIDVNLFLGSYPWRRVPGTSPEAALRAMDRAGIDRAWATHLPGLFWRDPAEGNAWLYEVAAREARFRPVPAVHPGLPRWESDLCGRPRCAGRPRSAATPRSSRSIPSVPRCGRWSPPPVTPASPSSWPCGSRTGASAIPTTAPRSCRRRRCALWCGRIRGARFVVTHADRGFVQEVHFGSTPEEAGRIWWDICWLWGPPEDHLEMLLATIGIERFVFGTGLPLRIPGECASPSSTFSISIRAPARRIEHRNAERAAAG